mmetsp:Transcript_9536/g.12622  ORF Transcript_9536/g.12622 Transcript_9536/m.12622 type:complete len:276 (-) Transcript_9536:141-968(-)|eukprot:CAMPEP_0198140876 /NCGR_PEP_ID=MMETSP1443-20131203/3964_1 /TAXON_ID=186043 /ORGANISM="Entomoneis sp., Strain CCMP2396" /LENGTH=275 /DNA_ID=CAMNT_0043803435 /DNA_START=101 /DNA_END=928 /DNA_ORIENTATION=+
MLFPIVCLLSSMPLQASSAFAQKTFLRRNSVARSAAGQGFGIPPGAAPRKTYGRESEPSRDVIDLESAMTKFFTAREEWMPLFRTLAVDTACPAYDYLGRIDEQIDFHEESTPWRRLKAIPEMEEDRTVLAGFLDEAQKSLVGIPVDETTDDDDDDLQFVEEGRRFLALSRFHVMRGNHGGSVENIDALFSTCWNEIMELSSVAEGHTGSLIMLPQYELSDLRRFTDMNVLQPLEWLGIGSNFEVSSFQRGSPAIRLLYKLSDIPDLSEKGNEDE